jgi:KDO2-lipid IV(A) lauroyltransferase
VLSGGLQFIFQHVIKYRQEIIENNLQNAFPEKQQAEIDQLKHDFYRHFCDLLLESIKGLTLSKQELQRRFVYTNPEIFSPLFEKKQSAILLGSHYGNWEWGVLSFPLAVQHKVTGIYKPLKNRPVDAWVNQQRKRWGLHLVSMNQAGRAVVEIRQQPSIFVLIADQTPSDIKNAHWLPFLHQDTPFLQGADKLARQTDYPVFIFDIQRVKRGFYEVTFTELCQHPSRKQAGEITELFARHLEATILDNPANWLWSHRRWKRKRRG